MIETRSGLRPGPGPRTVRDDAGVMNVPPGWEHLPPGDAAVTRAVKALGPTWGVEEPRGRKVYSRGILGAGGEHHERARGRGGAARRSGAPAEASRRRGSAGPRAGGLRPRVRGVGTGVPARSTPDTRRSPQTSPTV